MFAENDQVVHVEVEPVPSGEVAEPVGSRAASDRNRVKQLAVQDGHRFFGASEFFPGERNAQAFDGPFHDAARADPECREGQAIDADKREITEKEAGTDAENHRLADVQPVMAQQIRQAHRFRSEPIDGG